MSVVLEQLPVGLMTVGRAIVRALTDSSTPLIPYIPKPGMSHLYMRIMRNPLDNTA